MHELSICTAIARVAQQVAQGRSVTLVRVDIGHLRQVVPDSLRHSWEMVVFGSALDGSVLEIREVAAVVECGLCRGRTELAEPVFRCGACGSVDVEVISGREMAVTSLDVVVEEAKG